MTNRIVWVDIPVRDLDRAIAFYGGVLGQPVTREGGPGFQFGLLPHEGDDSGGCLVEADEGHQPSLQGPLIYLNAEGRLAAAVDAAAALGGAVLEPPHPIGPHGFRAIVQDSEGNRIALHAPPG